MKKELILIFFVFLSLLCACTKKKFKSYESNFYPISLNKFNSWDETRYIKSDTISFRLFSYRDLTDYHEFEMLDLSGIELYSDKNIYVNDDTIKKGENIFYKLFSYDPAMITLTQQMRNKKESQLYYHLLFHKTNIANLKLKNDYYTFYIKSHTVTGFEINDSTIVEYFNR